jgi:hypothetical protein
VNDPLRILSVEDSDLDRELIATALRVEGLNCEFFYAMTEREFRDALERFVPDIILSDFTLPSFNGAEALKVARAIWPEVPFIFFSATIGEERAVEALKQGATDYVLKDRLDRLGPAIHRALREAQEHKERLHIEQQFRASEERFRQVVENIREIFWLTDNHKKTMLYVSPAYQKIWGRDCESLYESPQDWQDAIHPHDQKRVLDAVAKKLQRGDYDEEYRIVRPDGSLRWIHDRAFPIRDHTGEVYRIAGVADDITEHRQLEEQLRQSQKMEAIGLLAGGIAHDFNNMLAVIQMHSSLLLGTEDLRPPVKSSLQDIMAAAESAANLTRRLLTFSRREIKQASDLNLGEIVDTMIKLLRRILGEDVSLETRFASSLPLVHADQGMIEQVIMNLAINARDAMPNGGRLSVALDATAIGEARAAARPQVKSGHFVCLAVSDTGHGIAPEHLSRIFEPFFTTKEVGQGTGLGLATVFGIVEQHGGWVEVESELGRGSTFRVFLPSTGSEPTAPAVGGAQPKPVGGSETILIVEDEAALRTISQIVLEQFGYRVFASNAAAEALQIWEKEQDAIHLVLTDLIMPGGMSGRELVERLLQDEPHLKVIYTSGYSEDIVSRQLHLDPGRNFLQKPCSSVALLAAVRRCLDEN